MKIALNALSAQSGAGVSMFINILPQLAQIDEKNSYLIFVSPQQRRFDGAIPQGFKKAALGYVPANPFLRILWEQCIFPFYLLWHRIDVLYSVGNTTSIFAPCRVVLLIENANPYSMIGIQWSRGERFRNKLLYILGWLSARRAAKIRFVSENSKKLILRQIKVPEKKCVVIPHGVVFDSPFPLGKGGVRENSYILTVGANGPHRNIHRLLKAFAVLDQYKGDLLIIGAVSQRYKGLLNEFIKQLELQKRVIFKGEVLHQELLSYYAHADALAFPSIEETFGIPLIEAMALGVPIAASDCDLDLRYRNKCFSPFREVCKDAAYYFNPFDVQDIAKGLDTVLNNALLRHELVIKGKERVKQYDLANTARVLVQLFNSVYNR